jgi:hypothetical protein
MADSDAIWIRNPFEIFERFNTSDIISSRGVFPFDVSKSLGAALCMGFVYLKATFPVKELLNQISAVMARQVLPDDQREINKLLFYNHSLQYPRGKKLRVEGSTSANTGIARTRNGTRYKVTLLPHETFRRECINVPLATIHKSVVLHCSGPKNSSSKSDNAGPMGLWGLKENFDEVPLSGTLESYLDRISALAGARPFSA